MEWKVSDIDTAVDVFHGQVGRLILSELPPK